MRLALPQSRLTSAASWSSQVHMLFTLVPVQPVLKCNAVCPNGNWLSAIIHPLDCCTHCRPTSTTRYAQRHARQQPVHPCNLDCAGPVPEGGLSDAAAFPGAAYAPYPSSSYAWNLRGSGEGNAAADAQRRAAGNAVQVRRGLLHAVELLAEAREVGKQPLLDTQTAASHCR
jgi:hypothetical protein